MNYLLFGEVVEAKDGLPFIAKKDTPFAPIYKLLLDALQRESDGVDCAQVG